MEPGEFAGKRTFKEPLVNTASAMQPTDLMAPGQLSGIVITDYQGRSLVNPMGTPSLNSEFLESRSKANALQIKNQQAVKDFMQSIESNPDPLRNEDYNPSPGLRNALKESGHQQQQNPLTEVR